MIYRCTFLKNFIKYHAILEVWKDLYRRHNCWCKNYKLCDLNYQFNWIKNKSVGLVLTFWGGWMLQSPDVSDLLSGPLEHCILQSVCKNCFQSAQKIFAWKELSLSNWFAAALWLCDGASQRSFSFTVEQSKFKTISILFDFYLRIWSKNWGTLARGSSTVWTIYKILPRPLNISFNACQNRPVDYHFNPALHMSLMWSCETHRITISNGQERNLHCIIKERCAVEMEALVWEAFGCRTNALEPLVFSDRGGLEWSRRDARQSCQG